MQIIKNLLAPRLLLFIAIAYTILVIYGSLVGPQDLPKITKDVSDKSLHFLGYFIWFFTWFFYFFFGVKSSKFFTVVWKVVGSGLIFGIVIELIQGEFTVNRSAEIKDVAANFAGLMVAASLVFFFKSKLLKLKNDISF